MGRTIEQLKTEAARFENAQRVMAANTNEDSTFWHHVAVADLLRDLAAAIPDPIPAP